MSGMGFVTSGHLPPSPLDANVFLAIHSLSLNPSLNQPVVARDVHFQFKSTEPDKECLLTIIAIIVIVI